MPICWSV